MCPMELCVRVCAGVCGCVCGGLCVCDEIAIFHVCTRAYACSWCFIFHSETPNIPQHSYHHETSYSAGRCSSRSRRIRRPPPSHERGKERNTNPKKINKRKHNTQPHPHVLVCNIILYDPRPFTTLRYTTRPLVEHPEFRVCAMRVNIYVCVRAVRVLVCTTFHFARSLASMWECERARSLLPPDDDDDDDCDTVWNGVADRVNIVGHCGCVCACVSVTERART